VAVATSIDPGPLLVLMGLVEANAILIASGAIRSASCRLEARGRLGPPLLVLVAGLLSAVLLNDAVVLQAAPMMWSLADTPESRRPLLLALLLAAVNVGSSIGPYGNPQDALILHHYNLGPHELLAFTLPAYTPILALLALAAYLAAPRSPGPGEAWECPPIHEGLASLGLGLVLLTTLAGLTGHEWIGPLAGTLAVLLLGLARRVDWPAIIVVGAAYIGARTVLGLLHLRPPTTPLETYEWGVLLSVAVSNVPATAALLGAPWRPLHLAVNLAGLVHPYSSMANMLGLRSAGARWRDVLLPGLAVAVPALLYGLILALH